MGTTFWLSANNERIYAHMFRGPLGCVGTLVFSRIVFVLYLVMESEECWELDYPMKSTSSILVKGMEKSEVRAYCNDPAQCFTKLRKMALIKGQVRSVGNCLYLQ